MKIVRVFLFSSVALILMCSGAHSQIPNSSFESWVSGEPAGWTSNNGGPILVLTQSSDAHSGSSAAQGTVYNAGLGFTIGATLATKSGGTTGFAVAQRYASLSFFYKFTSDSGDAFNVQVGMVKGGTPIGAGTYSDTANFSSYKQASCTIIYNDSATVPDTAVIAISISPLTGCHANTKFIVDDLAFGTTTAVENHGGALPDQFVLRQNFPNPFNPASSLRYDLPRAAFVRLTVYDILGRVVATLVNGYEAAGEHSEIFDATRVNSGVYYYTLDAVSGQNGAEHFTAVRKMIVLK
ncbi:MAG TPA: T9SS type A sorting domain-containing protein [Bacteroidota bacterium]|nr:T9SS type A sorting domain-containing protein [Bacteroidota bacterium]